MLARRCYFTSVRRLIRKKEILSKDIRVFVNENVLKRKRLSVRDHMANANGNL